MGTMTLAQLRQAGGIVPREPVKKTVTWKHVNEAGDEVEDTFDVFIVRQSLGSFRDLQKDDDREKVAAALSKCLMLGNGKGKLELISYEDAYQLDLSLSAVILEAVREVNGGAPKNSTLPTNSSASLSPAESAAAP